VSSRTNITSFPCLRSDQRRVLTLLVALVFLPGLSGCGKTAASEQEIISTPFHVGQAVFGTGKEVAHIDIIIGHKDGPVGAAFVNALASQKEGYSNLLAVIGSNTAVKPATVLIPKVSTQDSRHSTMLFGPAQSAVGKAVADCMEKGRFPAGQADQWVIVCLVYLHWDAQDVKKVYKNNYVATTEAIEKALSGRPGAEEINKFKANLDHPWMPSDSSDSSEETKITASRR
jgi:5,6,7,8-tetrahydromethanopterin hydro-lyase